jgi:hypothetical protein
MHTALKIVQSYFPGVESVKDSRGKVKVEVTKGDVSTSKRKKHAECAMAVACKRAMKLDGVIISTSTAYLIKGKQAIRFHVPNSVSREVVSFDRGATFEPGTYELMKPTWKLGKHRHGKATGTGKLRPINRRHLTSNVRAALGSDSVR